MKLQHGCIECVNKQADRLLELFSVDVKARVALKEKISHALANTQDTITAPVLAKKVADIVRSEAGQGDPFGPIRERSNRDMEKVYPFIRDRVLLSADRLRASIVASALGNTIDFGVADYAYTPDRITTDFVRLIEADRSGTAFGVDDHELFKNDVQTARTILFIADNAGEIVLDRLLIEWIFEEIHNARVYFCVRGLPILNDAILDDAKKHIRSKLPRTTLSRLTLIDTGSDVPGVDLAYASENFRNVFDESDLVISKGQGNFETLIGITDVNGDAKKIYFIFRAKCSPVADYLSVKQGSLMLYRNRRPGQ
jgi:uncharacterized protein with ATP-grasp and redox domains